MNGMECWDGAARDAADGESRVEGVRGSRVCSVDESDNAATVSEKNDVGDVALVRGGTLYAKRDSSTSRSARGMPTFRPRNWSSATIGMSE